MARKTEETIKAENEVLARALVQALDSKGYSTDILTASALPAGFLALFRDSLPKEFKTRWKPESMPHQWRTRKAALIPMVEELIRRPEEPTVLPQNTDVLQSEETPVSEEVTPESIQEETPSYTEQAPDVLPEDTKEYAPPCKTSASEVLHLDASARNALMAMLQWWQETGGKMQQAQSAEPRTEAPCFRPKGPKPKTIRLSDAMIEAAEQYAKQHRSLTGGTFSGLVEFAIWRLLGEPEELVIPEDTK